MVETIHSKGGKATVAKYGKKYMSDLARRSHLNRKKKK